MAKIFKIIVCDSNNKAFNLVKHRRAYAYKESFYNGETHYQGFWLDSMAKFELPSVFFINAMNQDFSDEKDNHLKALHKELIFGQPIKPVPISLVKEMMKRNLIENVKGIIHS